MDGDRGDGIWPTAAVTDRDVVNGDVSQVTPRHRGLKHKLEHSYRIISYKCIEFIPRTFIKKDILQKIILNIVNSQSRFWDNDLDIVKMSQHEKNMVLAMIHKNNIPVLNYYNNHKIY